MSSSFHNILLWSFWAYLTQITALHTSSGFINQTTTWLTHKHHWLDTSSQWLRGILFRKKNSKRCNWVKWMKFFLPIDLAFYRYGGHFEFHILTSYVISHWTDVQQYEISLFKNCLQLWLRRDASLTDRWHLRLLNLLIAEKLRKFNW